MSFLKLTSSVAISALALTLAAAPRAQAGGIIGNIFREVGNLVNSKELRDIGDGLDGVHRGIKEALPHYGLLEEVGSGLVHQLTSELGVEIAGPILAELIRAGISDANNGELKPLPPHVKRSLAGYFPADLLDKVRWRSGYGTATLQSLSLKLGNRDAITLDNIIVFEDGRSIENLHLVAHEVAHVLQYHQWGITDFAKRYVRNYGGVEAAAERMAQEWASGKRPLAKPARPTGGGGGGGGAIGQRNLMLR
jgi:hypothetical protein